VLLCNIWPENKTRGASFPNRLHLAAGTPVEPETVADIERRIEKIKALK
jgi:hypothetical protein